MNSVTDHTVTGVALIGAGMIARTPIAALAQLCPRVHLQTVVSRHPERATHLAKHYPGDGPEFTDDLASIIANPGIGFAIVATPPSVRISLIEALAGAGKHILLEKPVARTLGEYRQIVEICEHSGVTLGIVFQHRMRAPSIAAVKNHFQRQTCP